MYRFKHMAREWFLVILYVRGLLFFCSFDKCSQGQSHGVLSRNASLVGKPGRKQPIFPPCDDYCHKEVHVAKGPTHEKCTPNPVWV